jgi:hypothetical protein
MLVRLPVLWPTSKARGILLSIGCLIPLLVIALAILVGRLVVFIRTR